MVNCRAQQWRPQRTLLYHASDEDWQAHHAELWAYKQHQPYIRGIPTWRDQKIIREIGGHFHIGHTQENAFTPQTWMSELEYACISLCVTGYCMFASVWVSELEYAYISLCVRWYMFTSVCFCSERVHICFSLSVIDCVSFCISLYVSWECIFVSVWLQVQRDGMFAAVWLSQSECLFVSVSMSVQR